MVRVGERTENGAKGGRLVRNIGANLLGLGATLLVGVLFTPYLVRHLGLDGYGLVPLANTLSAFLTPITVALSTPFARDLAISLERKDVPATSVVFNSGLFGSVLLATVIAGLALPVVLQPFTFFRIAPGYEHDSRLLLAGSAAAFIVATVSTPFESVTFCRNRFDLRNLITILGTATRVFATMLLFTLVSARPRYVGAGLVAGSLVSATLAFVAYRLLLPEVRIELKSIRLSACLRFVRTGAWLLFQQIGTVLFLNIDIVVVNRMIGAREAGLYSLALVWSTMLVALSSAVGSAFSPTILRAYGRNDDSFASSSRRAVRLVSIIMALPVAALSGLAPGLLRVWQGPDFVHLAPLLAILTLIQLTTLGFMPLSSVFVASDRVRAPSVAQLIAGVLKLILAVVLVRWFDLGMYGVAIAGGVLLVARSSVYNALLASKITGVSALDYVKDVLPAGAVGLVSAVVMWSLVKVWPVASWAELSVLVLTHAALYGAASWLVVLVPEEKVYVKGLVRRALTTLRNVT